jgi:hypothetical protein
MEDRDEQQGDARDTRPEGWKARSLAAVRLAARLLAEAVIRYVLVRLLG